jgi:hypothetical protein
MKEPQSLCQGQKKLSCPWNRDIIVCERWEMGEERKKNVLWSYEREMRNKIDERVVSEYYWSKLVSIFTHQNFLVKVVRLLGVVF